MNRAAHPSNTAKGWLDKSEGSNVILRGLSVEDQRRLGKKEPSHDAYWMW